MVVSRSTRSASIVFGRNIYSIIKRVSVVDVYLMMVSIVISLTKLILLRNRKTFLFSVIKLLLVIQILMQAVLNLFLLLVIILLSLC